MTGQFAIRLILPLPAFGAKPGDRILVRPGHPDPVLLIRSLPQRFDVITRAIADGSAEPLDPEHSSDEVRQWVDQAKRRPHRGGKGSPLQLVP